MRLGQAGAALRGIYDDASHPSWSNAKVGVGLGQDRFA